jgi:hypothetical protein
MPDSVGVVTSLNSVFLGCYIVNIFHKTHETNLLETLPYFFDGPYVQHLSVKRNLSYCFKNRRVTDL